MEVVDLESRRHHRATLARRSEKSRAGSGMVIYLAAGHAPAATGGGYRSGLNSCRGTPVACSTASTRKGGTSSHCDTACTEMPSGLASSAKPPTASIARRRASALSVMAAESSIALSESQAMLHCATKALLYPIDMTMGKRISAAMARLSPPLKQVDIAKKIGVSAQAVSQWLKDEDSPRWQKLPPLARLLRVPCVWLIEGDGPPPPVNDPMVIFESLDSRDQMTVIDTMEAMAVRRPQTKEPVRRSAK